MTAPEETPVVTTEPTAVPTTQPTPVETLEPTVIPTTEVVTAEPTAVPTTLPTTVVTTDPTVFLRPNTTIELNQSSGSPQAGGYDLSWTANVTDPPLNTTNLQGTTPGSQYWEINGSTGTPGVTNYYPLDLGGLLTNSLVGIWIHDVSNVILDGMGNTLQYNGPANTGCNRCCDQLDVR